MRHTFFVACMWMCGWVMLAGAQQAPPEHIGLVKDWSSHHIVFAENGPLPSSVLADPRFWQQYYRRHPQMGMSAAPEQSGNSPEQGGNSNGFTGVENPPGSRVARDTRRDWSVSLGSGSGGTISGPALFGYNPNGMPDCVKDYAVTGIAIAGSGTQANLIGLNQLYVNSSGTGFCSGKIPTVIFAYNVGPGVVSSLVAISEKGDKLAFSENNTGGTSYFHVLQYQTAAGNGTSATAPATAGTGNTAVDTKIALSSGSTTGPFVDYGHDTAYVTTNGTVSIVHKFSGVFLGTPKEVTTGGWPATIPGNPAVSTPVYDTISQHVFCTDGHGYVDYVDDSVSPAVVHSGSFSIASTGITAAPVIVDSSRGKVYAFANNPNGTNAEVAQADTNLTAASKVVVNIGAGTTNYQLEGDFNNAYYTGGAFSSSFLYVAGNDGSTAQLPALYNIGFNSSFTLNSSTANGPLALATGATATLYASPLTEFDNSTLGKDFLFSGVTGSCQTAGDAGCIRSLDITSGFPAAASVNNVILTATGGTGSITVDNSSNSAGASNVYFTPLGGKAIVKATQAALQ